MKKYQNNRYRDTVVIPPNAIEGIDLGQRYHSIAPSRVRACTRARDVIPLKNPFCKSLPVLDLRGIGKPEN